MPGSSRGGRSSLEPAVGPAARTQELHGLSVLRNPEPQVVARSAPGLLRGLARDALDHVAKRSFSCCRSKRHARASLSAKGIRRVSASTARHGRISARAASRRRARSRTPPRTCDPRSTQERARCRAMRRGTSPPPRAVIVGPFADACAPPTSSTRSTRARTLPVPHGPICPYSLRNCAGAP